MTKTHLIERIRVQYLKIQIWTMILVAITTWIAEEKTHQRT